MGAEYSKPIFQGEEASEEPFRQQQLPTMALIDFRDTIKYDNRRTCQDANNQRDVESATSPCIGLENDGVKFVAEGFDEVFNGLHEELWLYVTRNGEH